MAKRRKNRARRRKTQKKITRTPARKTFLGYRKLGASRHVVTAKSDPYITTKKRYTRRVSDAHQKTAPRKLFKPSRSRSFQLDSYTHPDEKKRLICRNRAVRREIMFATKKSGKGGQNKPVYRNPDVKCRRK